MGFSNELRSRGLILKYWYICSTQESGLSDKKEEKSKKVKAADKNEKQTNQSDRKKGRSKQNKSKFYLRNTLSENLFFISLFLVRIARQADGGVL